MATSCHTTRRGSSGCVARLSLNCARGPKFDSTLSSSNTILSLLLTSLATSSPIIMVVVFYGPHYKIQLVNHDSYDTHSRAARKGRLINNCLPFKSSLSLYTTFLI